jgi:phage gpG-like protein
MLAAIAREFVSITKRNFGVMGVDRPRVWPPLSKNYQKRIRYFGPPTLVRSGVLMNSIHIGYISNTSASVETDINYASVHQFGGGNNIPARPYFPVQQWAVPDEFKLTPYAEAQLRAVAEREMKRLSS